MVIRWEEPARPRRGPGSARWATILDELRGHAGEWAVVAEDVTPGYAAGAAATIKTGRVVGAAPGEFEATYRRVGGGTANIYARYVGE